MCVGREALVGLGRDSSFLHRFCIVSGQVLVFGRLARFVSYRPLWLDSPISPDSMFRFDSLVLMLGNARDQ